MAGHPLDRDIPWLVEPELLARTVEHWGRARYGWLAIAGAGVAPLHTNELCGGDVGTDEHPGKPCIITIARDTALEGSLTAGGYVDVSHVQLFAGLRASADTGGDVAGGLVAGAGATF